MALALPCPRGGQGPWVDRGQQLPARAKTLPQGPTWAVSSPVAGNTRSRDSAPQAPRRRQWCILTEPPCEGNTELNENVLIPDRKAKAGSHRQGFEVTRSSGFGVGTLPPPSPFQRPGPGTFLSRWGAALGVAHPSCGPLSCDAGVWAAEGTRLAQSPRPGGSCSECVSPSPLRTCLARVPAACVFHSNMPPLKSFP